MTGTGGAGDRHRLARLGSVARRLYVDSCSAMGAAVTAETVRHGKQPELNDAVVGGPEVVQKTGVMSSGRQPPRFLQ